jgi:TonB family protein
LLEEAVIIDLVSVGPPDQQVVEPTPRPQPASEKKVTEQIEKQPEPEVPEKKEPEIAIPEPVEEQAEQPPVVAKPISVKPMKRKKKLASDTRLAEVRERELRAARLKKEAEVKKRQEKLKQERRRIIAAEMAEKARLDAQRAAEEARRELAEMYKQQRQMNQSTSRNSRINSARSSSSSELSIVEQQFIANIRSHLTGFWVLPEMRNWNLNLKTTVWFTVSKQGELLSYKIVEKSGDPLFDQLVLKTMKRSSPMPRGPNLMKRNSLDFSASFTPGKLIM